MWNNLGQRDKPPPIGFERHFLFTQMFGTLFLGRLQRALIRELLTGNK
jgi:hypothetical protein